MPQVIRASIERAIRISAIGITLGALAVLLGLIGAGDAEAVGAWSGILFWALAVLIPATALVLTRNDMERGDRALYTRASAAYALLLIESCCGAALAMLFFFALATNAPVAFRGLDALMLRQAWSEHIGAAQISIVLAAALLSALAIATWAHRRVQESSPSKAR